MQNRHFGILAILLTGLPLMAQIYVATDGNDLNSGTIDQPLKTIAKAITVVVPGDTIYVRGGTHALFAPININSSQNGSDSSRYHLFAYGDERPLLDFSATALGTKGISLRGSY